MQKTSFTRLKHFKAWMQKVPVRKEKTIFQAEQGGSRNRNDMTVI